MVSIWIVKTKTLIALLAISMAANAFQYYWIEEGDREYSRLVVTHNELVDDYNKIVDDCNDAIKNGD